MTNPMSRPGRCPACNVRVDYYYTDDVCMMCGRELHQRGREPRGPMVHGVAYFAVHGWPDEQREEQARARESVDDETRKRWATVARDRAKIREYAKLYGMDPKKLNALPKFAKDKGQDNSK